jgi:hypothetical protein
MNRKAQGVQEVIVPTEVEEVFPLEAEEVPMNTD